MSALDSLNRNSNLDELIVKLGAINEPVSSDVSQQQNSLNINVQLEILKCLKENKADMNKLMSELTAVKCELNEYKTLAATYENKIQSLETENKSLQTKIEQFEVRNRSNTLVLSGPAIKVNANSSPAQLRDASIKNIKDIYNFELRKENVFNCQQMRMKDGKFNGRLLLTINNAIVKNELISSVIRKDKSDGVNLNIGEFLTKNNSNLLYQMRNLRRKHEGKIFSCFSRQGRIFFKTTKQSQPAIISDQADINDLSLKLEQQKGTLSSTYSKPQRANHQSTAKQNHRASQIPQRRSERNWRKISSEDEPSRPQGFRL